MGRGAGCRSCSWRKHAAPDCRFCAEGEQQFRNLRRREDTERLTADHEDGLSITLLAAGATHSRGMAPRFFQQPEWPGVTQSRDVWQPRSPTSWLCQKIKGNRQGSSESWCALGIVKQFAGCREWPEKFEQQRLFLGVYPMARAVLGYRPDFRQIIGLNLLGFDVFGQGRVLRTSRLRFPGIYKN